MNCKKGDLALVLCGPNAGRLVTCLEALPAGHRLEHQPPNVHQYVDKAEGPLWRVDRDLEWGDLLYVPLAPDAVLMPIGSAPGREAGESRNRLEAALDA